MRTDFNPQGPRGPRRVSKNVTLFAYCISIHKALAGLDTAFPGGRWHRLYFNPQGPRGPRRCTATRLSLGARFQSTRPSRASTRTCAAKNKDDDISIHKALAGLDPPDSSEVANITEFQSTRPSRASTQERFMIEIQANFISIHKALAGLDSPMQYIYKSTGQFQSTRPSRASTPTNIDFRIF